MSVNQEIDALFALNQSIQSDIRSRVQSIIGDDPAAAEAIFRSLIQMITFEVIIQTAESEEVDPRDVVDEWAENFYEALDAEEEDDEGDYEDEAIFTFEEEPKQ